MIDSITISEKLEISHEALLDKLDWLFIVHDFEEGQFVRQDNGAISINVGQLLELLGIHSF